MSGLAPNDRFAIVCLRRFTPQTLARLQPTMEPVNLPLRHVLVQLRIVPTTHVCFLESGLASVVATSSDDEMVEVGHVGREGVTEFHVFLGTDRTPNKTFMQVEGAGVLIPVRETRCS